MGMERRTILDIARAAVVHDIGQVDVPSEILNKASHLSAREREIVQQHCLRGFEVLSRIPFLRFQAELVYAHHERFDGSGYPRRLVGEAIPLGARVISIAEALDALTSERPFRSAVSFTAAISEIKRWSGTQFDPKIVNVAASMPTKIWRDLRREVEGDKFAALPPQSYVDEVCERIAANS
jgi:HD-GYP domain-containing protein (c-di-GMP phosphodiesterase class II)